MFYIVCWSNIYNFTGFRFPFYYDIKLIVVLWISCPFTKGSTIIYKNLVHPTLLKKEIVCIIIFYTYFKNLIALFYLF